jgi:hypothetical protein
VGVNVDGDVIPVFLLVNVYVHASSRAIFFSRTFFFYDHLGRRCCLGGGCFSRGGSYWRRRLLTSGDPE